MAEPVKPVAAAAAGAQPGKIPGAVNVPPGGKEGVSFLSAPIFKFFKGGYKHLDISSINLVLVAGIAFLLVYFFINFSSSLNRLKTGISIKEISNITSTKEQIIKEVSALRGLPYYMDKINKRDIFKRADKQEEYAEPVFSSKFAELTSNLRLAGISWSDNPDAMVEDTKLGKTYFVQIGANVGELKVENIQKDKIVLRYNKELFELK
jgi:hypothetical protein